MLKTVFTGEWLEKNWKEKVIFLNREHWATGTWTRSSVLPLKDQYHIGVVKDGYQSLRSLYLSQKSDQE